MLKYIYIELKELLSMKVVFRGKEGFVFTEAIENYLCEKLKKIGRAACRERV